VEIVVGLWSRKTVAQHAMQSAQIKMQQLQTAVQRLAQEAARLNAPAKQKVKSIFIAPEYYFAKKKSSENFVYDLGPADMVSRSLDEKQKDLLLKHLQRLSKRHKGMLIVPGTMAWKKKLSKSIRRKAKAVLNVVRGQLGEGIRGGGIERQPTATRNAYTALGLAPRLARIPTVRWCLSPHKMKELKFEKFCKIVVPQYRMEKQYERIFKVWAMSPYSIGCQAGTALDVEAKILVEGLRNIQEQIVDVEETIEDICLCFDDYKLLLTIPGFGPYISAVVLAAIGIPFRFQNTKELIRLAGYDLNANRSGKNSNTAVPVISKKGKADLRYALYQAALIATSSNTNFRAYFHKLLKGREREKGIRTKKPLLIRNSAKGLW